MLGTKSHMSQVWGADGRAVPVTVLSAGPLVVTQVKDTEKDGYSAVQVGFKAQKKERLSKPILGHLKELASVRHLREFRGFAADMPHKRGDVIDASVFAEGDAVTVSAISKGKGFQGVVKRHGFHGGSRTHGQKHSEREPGAIGGGGRAGGRVAKGMRMAGRMGGERITVKGLRVVAVDSKQNLLLVSGAVPGRRGTLVEIRSANPTK
ncbi:MAG: large subunit ribosomal protein L3 [Parcubacteria group bacterium Gr01-1014_72]|nr:MAG: large subunit ribosomal protein L3 [Parcubacteria group bacterium Gr01-1014_72]